MNTLRYLILKKLVKRSPKSTRAGIIQQLNHIDNRTVACEFDHMLDAGILVLVNDGSRTIARISTDYRRAHADEIETIQWELDNEK